MNTNRDGWREPRFPVTKSRRHTDGTWLLTVLCGYCGRQHTHGGGSADQPVYGGNRVPHCAEVRSRGKVVFDASLKADLPNYEIAAPGSVDQAAERAYAAGLVEQLEARVADTAERKRLARRAEEHADAAEYARLLAAAEAKASAARRKAAGQQSAVTRVKNKTESAIDAFRHYEAMRNGAGK